MNSPNFLIILGLFSIIWQIPDGAMATPVNKEGTLFNYDDEPDYFQPHGQQKPPEKEESERGKNLYQMPSKPVLSEDDAELALMSDMSIYTDDDVAWEHEHGRSGIFRGLVRDQKLRSPPAVKKRLPVPVPVPVPIYPLYPYTDSKPAYGRKSQSQSQSQNQNQNQNQNQVQDQKNLLMDPTNMSIGKWIWMEKILRQQAGRY